MRQDFREDDFEFIKSLQNEKVEYDLPKKLYKYTKRRFAHDFVRNGRLRLAPLLSYRDGGAHQAGQHDPSAGNKTFSGNLPSGVKLALEVVSTPSLIHCWSEVFDPSLLKRYHPSYDTIYEVDASALFKLVTKKLGRRFGVAYPKKISYVAEDELFFDTWPRDKLGKPIVPMVDSISPESFSWQAEWRIVVEPFAVAENEKRNMLLPSTGRFARHGFSVSQQILPLNTLDPMFTTVPKLKDFSKIRYAI